MLRVRNFSRTAKGLRRQRSESSKPRAYFSTSSDELDGGCYQLNSVLQICYSIGSSIPIQRHLLADHFCRGKMATPQEKAYSFASFSSSCYRLFAHRHHFTTTPRSIVLSLWCSFSKFPSSQLSSFSAMLHPSRRPHMAFALGKARVSYQRAARRGGEIPMTTIAEQVRRLDLHEQCYRASPKPSTTD